MRRRSRNDGMPRGLPAPLIDTPVGEGRAPGGRHVNKGAHPWAPSALDEFDQDRDDGGS